MIKSDNLPTIPWAIYDDLIGLIPDDLCIENCLVGSHWILIKSLGVGIAMTPPDGDRTIQIAGSIKGMKVKILAEYVKSWHPLSAALGLAAINSFVNATTRTDIDWDQDINNQPRESIFVTARKEIAGKKVTVVGHFPDLDEISSICNLSILERKPLLGDFPDPACEYILPDQDYVYITGTTLINKTLPRLLQLSRNAKVVLVGPSTPLTPLMFEHGINQLAGTVVEDEKLVWQHVAEGGNKSIFQFGARMMKFNKTHRRSR